MVKSKWRPIRQDEAMSARALEIAARFARDLLAQEGEHDTDQSVQRAPAPVRSKPSPQ